MTLRRAGSGGGLRRAGAEGGLRLMGRGRVLASSPLSEAGLPSFMTFTRGAGGYSYQDRAAVAGQTFIVTGTTVNAPRFDYDPTTGRRLLLIEPTRTNALVDAAFVDAAANAPPTGWINHQSPYDTEATGGPHGGPVFVLVGTAGTGIRDAVDLAAATEYAVSRWVRRTGTEGAATLYTIDLDAGTPTISIGAVNHDWTHYASQHTKIGAAGDLFYGFVCATGPGAGASIRQALPQVEAGDCATSWISTVAGAAARAAELCAIDPAVVGRLSGDVSLLWRPDYPSTAALTVDPVLHAWASGYELVYDPADDKLKVVVAGTKRAESAALTFARQAALRVRVRYGAAGQQLTVDGVSTSNATAWGDPGILAPYLGSRAASANCRPSGYGDYLSAVG